MSFKPHNFKVPPQQTNSFLKYDNFRGINLADTPTQLQQSESPDMNNMLLDDEGSLDSRTGFAKLFNTSLGAGQINGFYQFKKQDGTIITLIHHGTNLYNLADLNDL